MWYRKGKEGEIVTRPSCQGVKTATSLVVLIVVSSVLKERLVMHVAHGWIVEAFQDAGEVGRWRTRAGRVR